MIRPGLDFQHGLPGSPPQYSRPVQTTLASVLGLWHLLEQARLSLGRVAAGVDQRVYGDPEVHPQAETYVGHVNPIGPRSCIHGESDVVEAMCFAYHRQYAKFAIRVARISTVTAHAFVPAMAVSSAISSCKIDGPTAHGPWP